MPQLDVAVGRMLIELEQRLQPLEDKIRARLAAGDSYAQLRNALAYRLQLRKMVATLEVALAN